MYRKTCPYCKGSGTIPADNEYDGKTPEECAKILTGKIFRNIKI